MVKQRENAPLPYAEIVKKVAGDNHAVMAQLGYARRVAIWLTVGGFDPASAGRLEQTVPAKFRIFEEEFGGTVFDAVRSAVKAELQARPPTKAEIFVPAGRSGEGSTVWSAERYPKKRRRDRKAKTDIIREYLQRGAASRKTIAEETGMSPSTVTRTAAQMIANGELIEAGLAPRRTRRVGGGHERMLALAPPPTTELEALKESTTEKELEAILTNYGNDERKALDEVTSSNQGAHISLLGHLLYISHLYPNITLRKLFGKANMRRTGAGEVVPVSSPLTRSRIYRILAGRTEMGEAELLKELQEQYPMNYSENSLSTISTHLQNLSRAKIITYETRRPGRQVVAYSYGTTEKTLRISAKQTDKSYIRDVFAILRANPGIRMSRQEVAKLYLEMHPDKPMPKGILGHISRALNFLERHEHAVRGQLNADKRTGITLSKGSGGQRELIGMLGTVLTDYVANDANSAKLGRQRAQIFIDNPRFAAALRVKAEEASPDAKRVPRTVTRQRLLTIISDAPTCTIHTIQQQLELRHGQIMTHHPLQRILKSIANAGDIMIENLNGENYYSPAKKKE